MTSQKPIVQRVDLAIAAVSNDNLTGKKGAGAVMRRPPFIIDLR